MVISSIKSNSANNADSHNLAKEINITRKDTLEMRSDSRNAHLNRKFDSSKNSHASAHQEMKSDFVEKQNKNDHAKVCAEEAGKLVDKVTSFLTGESIATVTHDKNPLWLENKDMMGE
ncbi:MAG: hypothetical protein H0W50_09990 [Parachlamydiaceae bacterium]|nr:hypothetical protein [Parachlamydiaceae bacterium]